jgi:hypothetical protein
VSTPQLVDAANPLLAETPAQLATALIETPQGQRLVLTIRTASTTLSVLLGAGDAKTWATNLHAAAAQMSTSGLIVAAPGLPANGKVTVSA